MKIFYTFLFFPILFFGQVCDSLRMQSLINIGPLQISEINESMGLRNGTDYSGATLYYPINQNNLSSIVLVPGFMNTELTIQNWGSFLASHGIVTMTIGTNSLADTHVQRRDALFDAIISLKQENQRIGSPLFGKLDTSSIAVGGFSKGGGGAQLLAKIDPSLKAIVALYPWLENATASDLEHTVPLIIISGQLDAIAPPFLHADIQYNLTPITTKKLKYEVAFASHDAISGPYGGNGEVGARVLSWLNTFLVTDSCYCPLLLEQAITSSSYTTNVECSNLFTNIYEPNKSYSKEIVEIRDLYGRKTKFYNSRILIYIYNDGSYEKKITL